MTPAAGTGSALGWGLTCQGTKGPLAAVSPRHWREVAR